MNLGAAIGTACIAFAATNVDGIFVLVTFLAESATNTHLTPATILIGQYAGFTGIMAVSLVGFAVSLALAPQPIGFLGFLPLLLGLWNLLDVVLGRDATGCVEADQPELPMTASTWFRSIVKVGAITLINGGDNVSSYIPLFAQAKRVEIVVYVAVFYVMLGVWFLVGLLIMKEEHVLLMAQKHTRRLIPFLYMGLGVFVIVKSHCYPWSIERIDKKGAAHPGRLVMAVSTTTLLLLCMGLMFCIKWRRWHAVATEEEEEVMARDGGAEPNAAEEEADCASQPRGVPSKRTLHSSTEPLLKGERAKGSTMRFKYV
ncbi:Cadmium resistance transporter [Cordyceps fumosorosea ARSEF 2679]|uniref:Cadmium resistance transporter n=1 Tax=Cordyceps fumosorosea (strain ARSEF 2679) TaxID=1081104 RepID=A0A168D532_CORFA|nr:Cadmium resistance transporter [Cordyceps fumosorosea ARSEF 2679]OAA72178.1 Cadmium resistance transporter [Cordyceps fumosorosea ARSEF 2679]